MLLPSAPSHIHYHLQLHHMCLSAVFGAIDFPVQVRRLSRVSISKPNQRHDESFSFQPNPTPNVIQLIILSFQLRLLLLLVDTFKSIIFLQHLVTVLLIERLIMQLDLAFLFQ